MKIKLNIRNKWQNTLQLFQGEEREKRGKKKFIKVKPFLQCKNTLDHQKDNVRTLLTSLFKVVFDR
jgi:hypothetical protein